MGRAVLAAAVLLPGLVACQARTEPQASPVGSPSSERTEPREPTERPVPPGPWKVAAIAHGGVGSPPERSDGPRAAVDAALAALADGKDPLDAVVAGIRVMEDDPRFNAGTGARLRLDGKTAQLDAALMNSSGRFGAVAAMESVRNPILVARAVLDTPHILLVGDGATRFARALGFAPFDVVTDESRTKWRDLRTKLLAHDPSLPTGWATFDYRRLWNFETSAKAAGLAPEDAGTDTVGVAVRTADGRFAVGLSTGGTTLTLRGRVGDVPVLGAGLYAGPHGAIAATGTGERIVETGLARRAHDRLSWGFSPEAVAKKAVDELRGKDIGVIVIGPTTLAAEADRPMAWAAREAGATAFTGPEPKAP